VSPEIAVFVVFLVLAALAVGVLVAIARHARGPVTEQHAVQTRGYRLRSAWFWALAIVAVLAFALSLPAFPYRAHYATRAPRHYRVVAQQFSFDLPSELPADTPIVLDVTARDVNHGFGIYDPDGRIVAQVQAMPGYVNALPLRFSKRGQYVVRCMEFCGVAHAFMRAGFEVK
jgi:cytochrome c oxidase subunit 2